VNICRSFTSVAPRNTFGTYFFVHGQIDQLHRAVQMDELVM